MFRNICFFEFQTREKHFCFRSQDILIAENAAEKIRLKTEPEL